MKYIVLLYDGMSDRPVKELGGEHPAGSSKPHMDMLASRDNRHVKTIPDGLPPGRCRQPVGFGYDPAGTIQAGLLFEAASLGVKLAPADMVFSET